MGEQGGPLQRKLVKRQETKDRSLWSFFAMAGRNWISTKFFSCDFQHAQKRAGEYQVICSRKNELPVENCRQTLCRQRTADCMR